MIATEETAVRGRVLVGALVAGVGPVALALVITAVVGHGWRVHGGAAFVVGFVWLASFGMVGTCIARTRPLVLGALAGEAAAVFSMFQSSGPGIPIVVGLSVGAGVAGGAFGESLVEHHRASPYENGVLGWTAVLVAVACLALGAGTHRPPVATPRDVLGLTRPHRCPPVLNTDGPFHVDESLALLSDQIRATDPVPIRYDAHFTPAQIQIIGPATTVRFVLVVRPEHDDGQLGYQVDLSGSGYIRPDTSMTENVTLRQTECGPAGAPPLGRYTARLEVDTHDGHWVTPPARLTVLPG